MSDSNPNPEERARIVNAVMGKMVRKDILPTGPSELDQLFSRINSIDKAVHGLTVPVYNAELTKTSIHTEQGRAIFLKQILDFYVSYLKELDSEELIFVLAMTRAQLMMDKFV